IEVFPDLLGPREYGHCFARIDSGNQVALSKLVFRMVEERRARPAKGVGREIPCDAYHRLEVTSRRAGPQQCPESFGRLLKADAFRKLAGDHESRPILQVAPGQKRYVQNR